MHAKEISDLAVKLSQDQTGSDAYLGHYHKARQKVEEKLTEMQRQKYRSWADGWSNKQLPSGVKERYVHGNDSTRLKLADYCGSMMKNHGSHALEEFASTMFHQFGMRVVILEAHVDPKDDKVAVSL